jgi:hypothetical protein
LLRGIQYKDKNCDIKDIKCMDGEWSKSAELFYVIKVKERKGK